MQNVDERYILDNFDAAVKNGHIKPFFQPIIRSLSGKICAAETLARWDDPVEGLLAPYLFIDVLERRRLIHKLDLKMIDNICHGYSEMASTGIVPLPFSINLSRLDFEQRDIFEQIVAVFEKYDVPKNAVHLEITESVMLDNVENFRPIFEKFRKAGFEMWLDDFGSGYTSLNVLKDYDFEVLKIDMKFLSSIDTRSRMLISSVINMSKKMGIHTLAEGVETKEQVDFLCSVGCELMQGYHFAKPMSANDFEAYLKSEKRKKESSRERAYYKKAGLFNVLSTSPFDEFNNTQEYGKYSFESSLVPIEIIEISDGRLSVPFINKSFWRELEKIGLYTKEEMLSLINDRTKPFYHDTMRQIETTVQTGELVKRDYMIGDIFYAYTTKFLAKMADRTMIAASMQVFGGDGMENRYEDVSKFSHALFYNFERVTMIYPDSDSMKLIYANATFQKVYGTVSLRRGTVEFANAEVHDDDRERYLDFMEIDTLSERIFADGGIFIQQPFRLRTLEGGYRWRLVRVTKIPMTDGTNCYMYSIQRMVPVDIDVIEKEIAENPEMFKRKK
ncbi:MAG: EAL domain-containing protein [Firmicutes bacterium]|nr:EAL domain-containing protein [Bacillota bacterium]